MKFFLVAFLSLPMSLMAEGGLPNQPYIYVEGKAEIEKLADMVTLRFDLVARNADQTKANQEVQASVFAISPVPFPSIQRNIFGGDGEVAHYAVEPTKPDPSQYRLALVSVRQSVHVIYLISPAK